MIINGGLKKRMYSGQAKRPEATCARPTERNSRPGTDPSAGVREIAVIRERLIPRSHLHSPLLLPTFYPKERTLLSGRDGRRTGFRTYNHLGTHRRICRSPPWPSRRISPPHALGLPGPEKKKSRIRGSEWVKPASFP